MNAVRLALEKVVSILPRPVSRRLLTVAQSVRVRVVKHQDIVSRGNCMLLTNAESQVLLVRHSYTGSSEWGLPGGSVGMRESTIEAAEREITEELGCRVRGLHVAGWEASEYWGYRYEATIINGVVEEDPLPDGREVMEARFFPIYNLPNDIDEPSRDRISGWAHLLLRGSATKLLSGNFRTAAIRNNMVRKAPRV